MNKTLESIFKDIDVLGVVGGYDVEQLITPQDCRLLKGTIIDLQERIDKAIEYIENNSAFLEDDEYELFNKQELLDILKGSDSNE